MDKKAKKRSDVLRQRLTKLQQLIAAAKKQPDDAAELAQFQRELADVQAELAKLNSA